PRTDRLQSHHDLSGPTAAPRLIREVLPERVEELAVHFDRRERPERHAEPVTHLHRADAENVSATSAHAPHQVGVLEEVEVARVEPAGGLEVATANEKAR